MKSVEETFDVIVCGGGMAGFCAAMAAARRGAKACLIQDRPVLGGNASSEVRVTVHGAACHHSHCRETGIIGEALEAERRTNHLYPNENGWINSVHDMALYNLAVSEPNLTLYLNTTLTDVLLESGKWGKGGLASWPAATDERGYIHRPACHDGDRIKAIRATIANAETELLLEGRQFIDCTGDALLAHLAGCEWRMGSESREDTGEIHAPLEASRDTMGNSIHIRCIDTGRPAPFTPPDWAVSYDDARFFYEQGRQPNDPQGGYWWIEIGVPWDTIHDNETIRHELTRHALGVWDWMKNKDPKTMEKCQNYALDFIGQVPGKRESRRVMGLHFLNENELQNREVFPDECAFGGWFIDLHTPGGLLAPSSEPSSAEGYDCSRASVALKLIGPYGIPLRSLVSRDVANLSMAGRNISVTHAALGTVRVMGTCGLMGQAVGTMAAEAVRDNTSTRAVIESSIQTIQQKLLRDGCFLPNHRNADPQDLARTARVTASSSYRFSGLGTWESPEDIHLREKIWTSGMGKSVSLDKTPCQWFQLDGTRLDRIGLHLLNNSEAKSVAKVTLRKVASIWDYTDTGESTVTTLTIEIPAGHDGHLWLDTGLHYLSPGTYRLEVKGQESAGWRCSGSHALGVASGWIVGSGRFHWSRLNGEMAFQMEPPQNVYGPEQVLTGVTRPTSLTNAWLSDPGGALPQWLELQWDKPVQLSSVELTFPQQLVLETHWENPFYTAPHVARTYRLESWDGHQWKQLHREDDNRQTRRQHTLAQSVTTDRIRLLIEKTHLARSAGLVEIRCY